MFIIFGIGRCHRLIHSLLYRRRYQRPTGINLPLSIGGSPDDGIHIRPHQIGCGKIKIMDNPLMISGYIIQCIRCILTHHEILNQDFRINLCIQTGFVPLIFQLPFISCHHFQRKQEQKK